MDELTSLNNDTLSRMPKSIRVPSYDRSQLTAGIVHIGLGNFHRAHQAWYLHRLMDMGLAHDWAIIGAGVRSLDAIQREKLIAQDCLTTLIELDPNGMSAEVIGSMIGYVPVEGDNASLIARMAQPDTRIVSLTVTEGGYYIDPASGGFDANHPDVVHDAANPDIPRTAFGAIIAALKLRSETGHGPFAGLSCDNLQGNGATLRRTVVSLARLSDPDLADWIDTNCSFPNSMVDCIVPATGQKELALATSFGVADKAPVTHEKFRQWVIEDDFCAGRPPWEHVGVTFSKHVHDFEAMKLRILNGGHQIVAMAADLLGISTIAEAMTHSGIRAFLEKTLATEVVPHVQPIDGTEPIDYLNLILDRFANPEIVDTTRRVAFDGSSRHPGFIVPSIRGAIARETPLYGLALTSALWARYCLGEREDGSVIKPNDPNWDELSRVAKEAEAEPLVWLNQRQYYGDVATDARFSEAFSHWVDLIVRDGVAAAIDAYNTLPVPEPLKMRTAAS